VARSGSGKRNIRSIRRKRATGLAAAYKLGAWYHTGNRFADHRFGDDGTGTGTLVSLANDPPLPFNHRDNWGLYGVIDQMLWRGNGKSRERGSCARAPRPPTAISSRAISTAASASRDCSRADRTTRSRSASRIRRSARMPPHSIRIFWR
jgi:hypothetical protein